LAQLRVDERRRYNSELSRMKLDHEKRVAEVGEKAGDMEDGERRRLMAREKVYNILGL
jgi:hypothetical protein